MNPTTEADDKLKAKTQGEPEPMSDEEENSR